MENRLTAEGRVLHEYVDQQHHEFRRDRRQEFSLTLRSIELGLIGRADVVEFTTDDPDADSVSWQPFPVEYKRGRPKGPDCDRVQLCAQAMCLEEMYDCDITSGALFYGSTRKREVVSFDRKLRQLTADSARTFHQLIRSGKTPAAHYSARCEKCSLLEICRPELSADVHQVERYIQTFLDNP